MGAGWALPGPRGLPGGPQFNGTYEYKFRKRLALEVGVHTTITTTTLFTTATQVYTVNSPAPSTYYTYVSNYAFLGNARVTGLPFGLRYIYPTSNGKVEWSAGLAGAYMLGPNNYSEWAAEPSLGVRVAVDKRRHFWLGSTARFINDFGEPQARWFTLTADLGFRFGH